MGQVVPVIPSAGSPMPVKKASFPISELCSLVPGAGRSAVSTGPPRGRFVDRSMTVTVWSTSAFT